MIFFTLLFLPLVSFSNAANILAVFATASSSHQVPLQKLTRALADGGHNVTVITPMPANVKNQNYHEVNVSTPIFWLTKSKQSTSLQRRVRAYEMVWLWVPLSRLIVEAQFEHPAMQDFLRWGKTVKFDLIIFESLTRLSYFGLVSVLGNPPYIGIRTVNPVKYIDTAMGNIDMPSHIPSIYTPYTFKMSFFQRLKNTFHCVLVSFVRDYYLIPDQERLMRKYLGDSLPPLTELEANKSLLLIVDDVFNNIRPIFPNIVFVGPFHFINPKELPVDLKQWIDNSPKGVIYFSLGTNMLGKSTSESLKKIWYDVFRQFSEYHVIWKLEGESKKDGNVLYYPWLPQQDLLANPKVKLFITQGGLQSCQESVENGIPVLGIPMFADQDTNIAKLVEYGMALSLEYEEITYDGFYSAIYNMLHDRRYKENAMRMSRISKDRDTPPLEKAIWWVNYVLRHKGANHLRPPTYDLALFEYFLLDVIAFIILLIFGPALLVILLLKRMFKQCPGEIQVKIIKTNLKEKVK